MLIAELSGASSVQCPGSSVNGLYIYVDLEVTVGDVLLGNQEKSKITFLGVHTSHVRLHF